MADGDKFQDHPADTASRPSQPSLECCDEQSRAPGSEPTATLPFQAEAATAGSPQQSSSAALEMASVLFMDIIAYSKLPMDLQAQRIQQLQQIVRSTAEFQHAQQSDQVIPLPTGDGMALVFFQNPEAPIQCATEISRSLKRVPDIKLRMGAHTGPVYRIADINTNRNVAGGGINLAQRVMDCGDAGHILVSKTVGDILGQLSEWAPKLHDLGEAEVKHGVKVHVVNFYTVDVGNPDLPEKLRKCAAAPEASAPQPIAPHSRTIAPAKSGRGVALAAGVAVVVVGLSVAATRFGFLGRRGTETAKSTAPPTQDTMGSGAIPPVTLPPAAHGRPSPATGSHPEGEGASQDSPHTQVPGHSQDRRGDQHSHNSTQTPVVPRPSLPASSAAAQPEDDAAARTALQAARERMIRLASRASAISRTMETIEHQQRGSGIGMRADMAAARESMESFMDEAKASLASQDFDASKRNMDIAERQIEKLEAFLGR